MLIDKIPDERVKQGLKEYQKIVNPKAYNGGSSVGQSNNGIVFYYEDRFRRNQCFRKAAIDFYKDVQITLKNNPDCKFGCGRPLINYNAGTDLKTYLAEGWLIRLAMKHANENPGIALELIGMCGHDDVAQGVFSYLDTSEAGRQELMGNIERVKTQKRNAEEALKRNLSKLVPDSIAVQTNLLTHLFLTRHIDELSQRQGIFREINCPNNQTDFYLPGSISKAADISPALKEKIKAIQGEVPAKHYHVYGSALLGCKMAQKGMTPEQAVTVQKQAARFYRGLRMCTSSKHQLRKREEIEKSFQIRDIENSKEVETKILQAWNQKIKGELNCGASTEKRKCDGLRDLGIYFLENNERSVVLTRIATAFSRFDAARLYDNWYLGGGAVGGINIPCTDIRNRGPSDLMKPNEGFLGRLFKPSNWSDKRYEAASKKLATWDVDFEWTIAQHEVGSRYGAKLCSESGSKESPFEKPTCYESLPQNSGQLEPVPNPQFTPKKSIK